MGEILNGDQLNRFSEGQEGYLVEPLLPTLSTDFLPLMVVLQDKDGKYTISDELLFLKISYEVENPPYAKVISIVRDEDKRGIILEIGEGLYFLPEHLLPLLDLLTYEEEDYSEALDELENLIKEKKDLVVQTFEEIKKFYQNSDQGICDIAGAVLKVFREEEISTPSPLNIAPLVANELISLYNQDKNKTVHFLYIGETHVVVYVKDIEEDRIVFIDPLGYHELELDVGIYIVERGENHDVFGNVEVYSQANTGPLKMNDKRMEFVSMIDQNGARRIYSIGDLF